MPMEAEQSGSTQHWPGKKMEGGDNSRLSRRKTQWLTVTASGFFLAFLLMGADYEEMQSSRTTSFSSKKGFNDNGDHSKTFQEITSLSLSNDSLVNETFPNITNTNLSLSDDSLANESFHPPPQSKKIGKIPFYLYPLEKFPAFWGEEKHCDHSQSKTPKHDHADFAWQAMMRHPWRTKHPEDAKVAVLPLALDLWSRGGCRGISMDRVINETKQVLDASPIFPSARHLVLTTDFVTNGKRGTFRESLKPAGVLADMEGRGDCATSLGCASNCAVCMSFRNPNHTEMPTPPAFGAERKHSVHMVGQVDGRSAHRDRLALFQSKGDTPSPHIASRFRERVRQHNELRKCSNQTVEGSDGDHDRCVVTEGGQSRFETQLAQELSNCALCLRGDTLGSDGWVNALASGTAVIQVADGDGDKALGWLPFPDAVPWKDVVINIPRNAFRKDPARAIQEVLETTSEERLLELQRLSLHCAADLDWTAHNSRVVDNLIHEAYNVPCAAFDEMRGNVSFTLNATR